jgi:osmotically-inducible protein OsmY
MIQFALHTYAEREATSDLDAHCLVHQIEGRLHGSQYSSVRTVSCLYRQGKLVLRGRVPTFYAKQLVHSVVRSICQVEEIVDQIEVAVATRPACDFGGFRKLPGKPR